MHTVEQRAVIRQLDLPRLRHRWSGVDQHDTRTTNERKKAIPCRNYGIFFFKRVVGRTHRVFFVFLWTPISKPVFFFFLSGASPSATLVRSIRARQIILLTTHGTTKTQTRCCHLQLHNAGRTEDNDTHVRLAANTSVTNASVTALLFFR